MTTARRKVALALALSLAGSFAWPAPSATAQVDVKLSHSPVHPSADEQAWAIAKVVGGPFDRIRIDYDLYRVTPGSDLIFPDEELIESGKVVKTCELPTESGTQWCFAKLPTFSDSRMVRLRATVLSADGSEQDSESYFYANGAWAGQGPIPVRRSGPIEGRFDVVLVPDHESLQSTNTNPDKALDRFADGLGSVINTHIFGFEPYGGSLGNPYRRLYNFYYSRNAGKQINPTPTSGSCSPSALPSDMTTLDTHFDAAALLHCRSEDGASGYGRMPDVATPDACQRQQDYKCTGHKFMTSEMDYPKSLGHELGHLLHSLTDEYCGFTAYSMAAVNPNVFANQSACEAAAAELGYDMGFCTRICGAEQLQYTSLWKIDHPFEPSSIMDSRMHEAHSTFFNPTLARFLTEYVDCADDGTCYNGSFQGAMPAADATDAPVAESVPLTAATHTSVAANASPSESVPAAEFLSEAPLRARELAFDGSQAPVRMAQSILDLQRRLQAPLKEIGRDAPAAARRASGEVISEAPVAGVEIGVTIDLYGPDAQIVGTEPVDPLQRPGKQAAAPATITVIGLDENRVELFQETFGDPRWIEIEGHDWVRSEEGRVFLPIRQEGVTSLIVRQNPTAPPATPDPSGAAANVVVPAETELDLSETLRNACRRFDRATACP